MCFELSRGKKSSRDFRANSKAMRVWKEKYYQNNDKSTSENDGENIFEKKYKAHKENLEAKPGLSESNIKPVSYTHLTLPTILLV